MSMGSTLWTHHSCLQTARLHELTLLVVDGHISAGNMTELLRMPDPSEVCPSSSLPPAWVAPLGTSPCGTDLVDLMFNADLYAPFANSTMQYIGVPHIQVPATNPQASAQLAYSVFISGDCPEGFKRLWRRWPRWWHPRRRRGSWSPI